MKRFGIISAAVLFLLLGNTTRAYAWQEPKPKEEAKPAKEEPKANPAKQQEAKPARQEQQAKPAQHEEKATSAKQEQQKPAQHEEKATTARQEENASAKPAREQEAAKPAKQGTQTGQAKQEEHGKAAGQQHAQRTPDEEKRQRAAPALRLSARSSARIPDERFRASFGQEHVFVISEPVIVEGFSRFQYGGFSFGFIQPWPDGWYYTDDVYVDYIDGEYFLFNPYYPGTRVSISVVI
jgi:hypothetical protein